LFDFARRLRCGNLVTAPRQEALTDKCDSLPRTIKATVNSNGSTTLVARARGGQRGVRNSSQNFP